MNYVIVNVEERNRQHPDTFGIDAIHVRSGLQVGWFAKLVFELEGLPPAGSAEAEHAAVMRGGAPGAERMWVEITAVMHADRFPKPGDRPRYRGILNSRPVVVDATQGQEIEFGPEHIADFSRPPAMRN